MNDVAFGTVRLKQDVGPGIYTNTYACQFHSHSLSLLVSAVHFGVFHWSSLHAGFQMSTMHHIQRLKAKEWNCLSIQCSSILEKKTLLTERYTGFTRMSFW